MDGRIDPRGDRLPHQEASAPHGAELGSRPQRHEFQCEMPTFDHDELEFIGEGDYDPDAFGEI